MNVYKKLFSYIKPYFKSLIGGVICLVIVGFVNILIPWLFKFLIDDVLNKSNLSLLNLLAIGAVLAYFIKGIFNYTQIYLLTGLGEKVVVDIRNNVYQHLQRLSLSFFSRNTTGDLISRLTNDVNIIQRSITTGLSSMVLQPLMIIGTIAFLFFINWRLALVSFIVIPIIAFAINKFGQKMRGISSRIQDRISNVTSILQETISGIRIVKAFNMEDEEIRRFNEANDETLAANLKGVQIKATLTPSVELVVAIGTALILWYGGKQVLAGDMTAGELVTFLTYLGMLMSPINILSENYHLFQKAIGAAERIFSLLSVEEKVVEARDATILPEIEGEVKFQGVDFSYKDGELILKDINLTARPGETVALVGQSGAGKTTLANLIPRFYDPDRGQVLIDGVDVKRVTLSSLRKQIGIVPQDTILFKGTIAENIAYSSATLNMEEITEAATKANAHDFIMDFKDGYETEVGERGVSLSGGQKQRIAIARAILTNPRILILDEATSSLDTHSETLVQEALERLMADRTTFVIAHRLSTIIDADKIVVVKRGRIIEEGNHRQLLEKQGIYYNLYQNQAAVKLRT